jgi:hypothetical protein
VCVLLGAGKLEAGRLGAGAWWEAEGWTLEKLEAGRLGAGGWGWRLLQEDKIPALRIIVGACMPSVHMIPALRIIVVPCHQSFQASHAAN